MTPQAALAALTERRDLSREQMRAVMQQVMGGELTPAQIAGIVIALRCKGETVTELAAAAEVMRELSARVAVPGAAHLIDTCGTGGDALHTFNISTASALVAAAAGCQVAKHGGRSVSSSCGSADVLEALGVFVGLTPEQVGACVARTGIGFMFAPNHHSAMRHAAPVRRELGVRTLFNLLGPMTNPAGAPNQVMGVFAAALVGKLAQVLGLLGARHVLVVHGDDGLDEISISGPTSVAELWQGSVREYRVEPADFGLACAPLDSIRVADRDAARDLLLRVLADEPGPARDIVCLNGGAAIYAAGRAPSLARGVEAARATLASGAAAAKLRELADFTQHCRPAGS